MIHVKINGLPSMVDEGATVLEAAEVVFVHIPTLCYFKDCEPATACMLCVVKDKSTDQLIPACSAKVVDGMEIDTECDEVQSARRDVLNLLLSEHVGDCEAPCTRICPAHLDVPRMLREIGSGNMEAAGWMAKRDLAIPETLGYVCPAPCEKGCRRGQIDEAITIQNLHRKVGQSCPPATPPVGGKRVAVIGSGPAGLSCAWALCQLGYACTVFDDAPKAGGSLRENCALPSDVLDAEIQWLEHSGIAFQVGQSISMHEVSDQFEGVVFAEEQFSGTHFADTFYAEEHKLTVKAVANGKGTALAVDCFLRGAAPTGGTRFDSKIGKLRESEVRELLKTCSDITGRTDSCETEAERCLHCDCRKPEDCKLRTYAEKYGADQREFPADERRHVQIIGQGEAVLFEPGKCIKCGLCVKITQRAGEEFGLTFMGRGFNTQVVVPFGAALHKGLKVTANQCVRICPTGALAFADEASSSSQ